MRIRHLAEIITESHRVVHDLRKGVFPGRRADIFTSSATCSKIISLSTSGMNGIGVGHFSPRISFPLIVSCGATTSRWNLIILEALTYSHLRISRGK